MTDKPVIEHDLTYFLDEAYARWKAGEPLEDEGALIEKMAEAISTCSEMLNGRDQMLDAYDCAELSSKRPLTALVDDALDAWRQWQFGDGRQRYEAQLDERVEVLVSQNAELRAAIWDVCWKGTELPVRDNCRLCRAPGPDLGQAHYGDCPGALLVPDAKTEGT